MGARSGIGVEVFAHRLLFALASFGGSALLVVGLSTPDEPPVLAPGRETDVVRLLGGRAPSDELVIGAIRITGDRIEAEVLPEGSGSLLLLARGASQAPIGTTPSFDVEWRGDAGLRDAAQRHVRGMASRDDATLWSVPSSEPVRALIVGLLVALALSLAATHRRAPPAPSIGPEPSDHRAERFALAGAATAAIAGIAMAGTFRFLLDDFSYLMDAMHPFRLDPGARLISVTARFSTLAAVGSPPVAFAALNVAALTATAVTWGTALERAGARREVAVLAAALVAMGPGAYMLVRFASGFEHLLAETFAAGAVLAVDLAMRSEPTRARRLGYFLLAAVLAGCGGLTKLPALLVLPPLATLWTYATIRRTSLLEALVPLAVTGIPLALVVLCHDLVALEIEAQGELSAHAVNFARTWASSVIDASTGPLLAVLLVVATALLGAPSRARDLIAILARRLSPRAAIASVTAALVAVVPALLSGGHFPRYYGLLAFIPLTLPLAWMLGVAVRWARPPVLAAVAVALLLVPIPEVFVELDAAEAVLASPGGSWPEHGVSRFLEQLARESRRHRAPRALWLRARCEDHRGTAASRNDVREFLFLTSGGDGIRWVTGWHDTFVDQDHERGGPTPPGTMIAVHCRGRALRLEVATGAADREPE